MKQKQTISGERSESTFSSRYHCMAFVPAASWLRPMIQPRQFVISLAATFWAKTNAIRLLNATERNKRTWSCWCQCNSIEPWGWMTRLVAPDLCLVAYEQRQHISVGILIVIMIIATRYGRHQACMIVRMHAHLLIETMMMTTATTKKRARDCRWQWDRTSSRKPNRAASMPNRVSLGGCKSKRASELAWRASRRGNE